jgi:long-chain acyl-CoA synthetase
MTADTLCAAFQRTAATQAGTALRDAESGEVVTWAQYAQRVRAVAGGLHALGVRPGERVALLLRNTPAFHICDTALLHLGATPFSLYPTEPRERMQALMADSGARVLITEEAFRDRAPAAEHVITDIAALSADFDFEAAWRAVTPEHVATLVYTSGTTGEPKAVQIPHRAILHGLSGSLALAPAREPHRTVSFLPNAHISDRFMGHYYPMVLGGTTTCVPDHERLWDTLRDVRPTRFHGVPRTFEKLAEQARGQIAADPALTAALERGLARVRAGGGPGADPALAPVRERLGLDRCEWLSVAAAPSAYAVLEFHHAIGLDLAELWGMSEFMMALMNPPGRVKLGTVGVALPAVEARLAGDGELLLRGPHALDAENWVHSGDLAAVDADGYFTIVGRKKEMMINSSGKNLFPGKIEAAVKEACPLIGHVAVIADRRRFVSALIVLDPERAPAHPDAEAEVARGIAAANERLSRVERIRAWRVLDADWQPGGVELTNTMKLRRAAIEQRYADLIEELYA